MYNISFLLWSVCTSNPGFLRAIQNFLHLKNNLRVVFIWEKQKNTLRNFLLLKLTFSHLFFVCFSLHICAYDIKPDWKFLEGRNCVLFLFQAPLVFST